MEVEMAEADAPGRFTIKHLAAGIYDYTQHSRLADRGMRRYHPYSFDFDSTPAALNEPRIGLSSEQRERYLNSRKQAIERLKALYGYANIDAIVENTIALGGKKMSLVSYHNEIHEQARRSFVIGAYYPALVAACTLGERILNHLILDLRVFYKSTPEYKRVFRKSSFTDWSFAVDTLDAWGVLHLGVGEDFRKLALLRHRSIHFNSDTYKSVREDALAALQMIGLIVSKQFGYFGRQPWFIENTPGTQFVKEEWEEAPFVRTYILPRSGYVGPLFSMQVLPDGLWQHLDFDDYGDGILTDEQFAAAHRDRDPGQVVTPQKLESETAAPCF